MFDMNLVFEKYIAEKLKKSVPDWHIQIQRRGRLWSNNNLEISQKPDIIIKAGTESLAVLDVKWKSLKTVQDVSSNDIRQVYSYSKYWKTKSAFLLYPTFTINDFESGEGTFFNNVPCTIGWLQVISFKEDKVKLCEDWVKALINEIKTHSTNIPQVI
jgi:5-methylcytosine-specific restriction enzyme subunit McrC